MPLGKQMSFMLVVIASRITIMNGKQNGGHLGDEPGSNQQYVWQDLGECGGVVTPPPPTNTPPGPTNTPQPPTATPPNPTATPDNPSGTWTAGTYYATGELVQYNGQTYRCRQSHTAYTGWEPPNVPALWELVN